MRDFREGALAGSCGFDGLHGLIVRGHRVPARILQLMLVLHNGDGVEIRKWMTTHKGFATEKL